MTPSQRRLLHTNLKHMSPSLGLTHQSPVGSLLAQSIGDKGKATMFQLPTSGIRGRLHGQCTIQNNGVTHRSPVSSLSTRGFRSEIKTSVFQLTVSRIRGRPHTKCDVQRNGIIVAPLIKDVATKIFRIHYNKYNVKAVYRSPVSSLLTRRIGTKGNAPVFQLPASRIRGPHIQHTFKNNDFNTICIKKNDNGHEPDLSMNTSQPDAQNSSYVDPDQDEITIVVPEFEAMGVERPFGDYEIVESPLSLLYLNEFITDVVTKSM
ncbi:hypothetical protein DCAR_0623286 [Daucus carota subsp. sativus]|uniref:Uncharacterized protein n=1 Tax=Daucus carota subsp. sativus TaxID=79200 RepID=A0A164V6D7_DAUCS|nr:hypothetical protein DCAR_0623286 [Daucus carota subsp. sativus]